MRSAIWLVVLGLMWAAVTGCRDKQPKTDVETRQLNLALAEFIKTDNNRPRDSSGLVVESQIVPVELPEGTPASSIMLNHLVRVGGTATVRLQAVRTAQTQLDQLQRKLEANPTKRSEILKAANESSLLKLALSNARAIELYDLTGLQNALEAALKANLLEPLQHEEATKLLAMLKAAPAAIAKLRSTRESVGVGL